jgi:single-stranded-DNA-specific exonuclease
VSIFEEILKKRGLDTREKREAFLHPSYDARHDPFLLPDMEKAISRLVTAREKQEKITIYGDYDIDGLTATSILLDAFKSFGFEHVDAFIPNRFVEGYGLTVDAIERIAKEGAQLIVTVDCGSLSEKEIVRAGELGVDVIVTDHHNVAPVQPPAVAVINPKRLLQDHPDEYENLLLKNGSKKASMLYPFLDLAGCGVAFKLIQALQTKLGGLEDGQEKWLLDLVALGTVCDIVTLVDENRANVFWGLKVLAKTRRPGLKALMAVARVEPDKVNARSLGFGLGPRMNAAGRLETAKIALDMLTATDNQTAYEKAQELDALNQARRTDQDKIYKAAIEQAATFEKDNVLVVSAPDWNHGIVGIVAAKLLEKFGKPTFVLQEMGEEAKGSARSYGNFSAADAIRSADDVITKGGGHRLAAGVTLPTKNIEAFRRRVNDFYVEQGLKREDEQKKLLPRMDALADIDTVDEELIAQIASLEPFGSGNEQPILRSNNLKVSQVRRMGVDGQHVKLETHNDSGVIMQFLAFNAPEHFFVDVGVQVSVWYQPDINEWQGRRSVEGKLLHIEKSY